MSAAESEPVCCPRCGAEGEDGLCDACRDDAETETVGPLETAFSTPAEVHAFVHGFYAGLKRPHRFPSPPDEGESAREDHYWKGGVITAKGVWVAAAVVVTYTQIGGLP